MADVEAEANVVVKRRADAPSPYAFRCQHCGCDFALLLNQIPQQVACPLCGVNINGEH